ncbi:MAG: hypothetical protein J0G98_19525 [Terrimonas ferruginea]|uniref:hypothetical protein n=1 Tax=Terrimonas ferruginea TaxID=249 RepID=UPI001AD0C280|nr:hypothetical protein [Terrimonas ferruginea]MBN8785259.1 hypothetical protein [Terrimonas ferruginea]
MLVYPLPAQIQGFDGEHTGIDNEYFAPCMHAINEHFTFAGFEDGYLLCNPGGERVTLGSSAVLPMARSGESEPALPYDNDEAALEAALPGLDRQPAYFIRNPMAGSCPDFLLVDGERIVEQGGFSEETLADCTFTVEVAS